MASQSTVSNASTGSGRFVKNVLWNWTGIGISLFSGFVLTAYMIRAVGPAAFGAWGLAFTLMEYYALIDFGFRTATVKYTAHYHALNQLDKWNEVISTGLLYYSIVGTAVIVFSIAALPLTDRLFPLIDASLRPVFHQLVILVGISWGLASVLSVFSASLEGLQRFDITGKNFIVANTVRALATALLLWQGFGLVALGITAVAAQMFGYILNYIYLRRLHPQLRVSLSLVRWHVVSQLWSFGFHSSVATVSSQIVNQAAPLIIGHFRPPEFVGFYNVPVRLLNLTGTELAARVGLVTISKAAELTAHNETRGIVQMGIYTNRYCVTLFAPLAVMVTVWGADFLNLWIRPAALGATYAAQSAPLFLPMVLGIGLAVMGQYNSSTILFGMGRHKWYSRGLVAEAVLFVPFTTLAVKHYGILGAAWVGAILMILNRALWTSFVLCRITQYSWLAYLKAIYFRPLLCTLPAAALAVFLKATIFHAPRWQALIAAGLVTGTVYAALAWLYCVFPEHRRFAVGWLGRRVGFLRHLS